MGPTVNDVFPNLTNAKYLSLTDVCSGYHNMRLDEKSSYLTTFLCKFGRYRYKQLQCGADPVGAMFQIKIVEIFSYLPNMIRLKKIS